MIPSPNVENLTFRGDVRLSLEPAENLDLAAARLVRLAGHDLYVAPLSLRQILAIADYVPKLSALGAENLSGERLAPLAEVLWHGLRRAHPKLTRDEFFDLPITIAELVAALPVVIEQAGGRKVDGSGEEPLSGELEPHRAGAMGTPALAASASATSIGARSSPTS
jgi:hypothetical protein